MVFNGEGRCASGKYVVVVVVVVPASTVFTRRHRRRFVVIVSDDSIPLSKQQTVASTDLVTTEFLPSSPPPFPIPQSRKKTAETKMTKEDGAVVC